MTGPITFSHPVARQQLEDNGVVVTFREHERTTGATWWRKTRTGPKEGDVHVAHVCSVGPVFEDPAIERHAGESGFDSKYDWINAMIEFCGGEPQSGHLYRVVDADRSPREHDCPSQDWRPE